MLQLKLVPTVEQAYAHVRREDIKQAVMIIGTETTTGAVMVSKGSKVGQQHSSLKVASLSLLMIKQRLKHNQKEVVLTVLMQNITVKLVLSYMGIQISGMNSRKRKKIKFGASHGGSSKAALITIKPELSFI